MAIEIKNELRSAAIVDGSDGGEVIQIFGMTFTRTGVGIYQFAMVDQADPAVHSIYCIPGINELSLPRGRFISKDTLEVRSYLADGTPADCQVLFVEVHRYPGRPGQLMPAAPPIPTPGGMGAPALVSWGNNSVFATTVDRFLDPWYSDTSAPNTRIAWVAPRDGSFSGLNVIHNAPAGNGGDIVYTVEVNAAASLLTVTLASTGSTAVNDADTIAISKGDLLSLIVTKALSVGTGPSNVVATANFT